MLGRLLLLVVLARHPRALHALPMRGFADLFQRAGGQGASPVGLLSLRPESLGLGPTPSPQLLAERLEAASPASETEDWRLQGLGRGPPSHRADLRLFDAPDSLEPAVTLFRDRAAWCPYCEKVWLQLEEKRVPYRVEKSPLRCYGEKTRQHLAVNPSGMLPVAIIKGRVISESNLIMQELEDAFPANRPLLPKRGSRLEERVAPLMRLERRVFGSWFTWLTSRAGDSAAREMDSLLREVDEELGIGGGPYFLGEDFSLVDCMFAPFLERMAASLPYFKGFEVRCGRYPRLLRWYEAMDGREAYRGLKSDYYTHCHDLPPQIGACHSLPAAAPFAAEIDGGAWRVGFSGGIEPMLPADPSVARREAARSLLANFEPVVRFAARGAGERGVPGVAAPLADPNARPNEAIVPAVDLALKMVALSLVDGDLGVLASPRVGAAGLPSGGRALRLSLEYLRDRVGVPRDMSAHAARQLRAHLNLLLDALPQDG